MNKVAKVFSELVAVLLLGAVGGWLCGFAIIVCSELFESDGSARGTLVFACGVGGSTGAILGLLLYPLGHYLVLRHLGGLSGLSGLSGLALGLFVAGLSTVAGGVLGALVHPILGMLGGCSGFLVACGFLAADAQRRTAPP